MPRQFTLTRALRSRLLLVNDALNRGDIKEAQARLHSILFLSHDDGATDPRDKRLRYVGKTWDWRAVIARDSDGRFARDPRDGDRPFDDLRPPKRQRDGRSGRSQDYPEQLSLRIPKELMTRLRLESQKRDVSVTKIVLSGIAKEIQPEGQPQTNFLTDSPSDRVILGQNAKLPRLVSAAQSDPSNPIASYDKVGRWKQKAGGKAPPSLIDRGRR